MNYAEIFGDQKMFWGAAKGSFDDFWNPSLIPQFFFEQETKNYTQWWDWNKLDTRSSAIVKAISRGLSDAGHQPDGPSRYPKINLKHPSNDI